MKTWVARGRPRIKTPVTPVEKRVRQVMADRGWTLAQAGERAGMTAPQFWLWLTRPGHKVKTVQRIARALGVSVEFLVGGTACVRPRR